MPLLSNSNSSYKSRFKKRQKYELSEKLKGSDMIKKISEISEFSILEILEILFTWNNDTGCNLRFKNAKEMNCDKN